MATRLHEAAWALRGCIAACTSVTPLHPRSQMLARFYRPCTFSTVRFNCVMVSVDTQAPAIHFKPIGDEEIGTSIGYLPLAYYVMYPAF